MNVVSGALKQLFSTFGSRAISTACAAGAAFVSEHFKIVVDPAGVTSLSLGIYAIVHALLDGPQSQPASTPATPDAPAK